MKRGNVNIIIYSHKHFYATRKCCCYSNLCVEEIYAFFSRKLHGKMHFYSVCVKVKNILDLSQHLISPDFIIQGATPLLFNLIYVNICKKYVCCEKKRREAGSCKIRFNIVSQWNGVSLRRGYLIYRNYTDFPNMHVSIPCIYMYALLHFSHFLLVNNKVSNM